MPTIDFNKIFSTNAPSTPFTWSDSDYLQGWDSIEMTPPSRQQFNALHMISDLKDQELNNVKAPKHSPVFTGDPQAPTPAWNDSDTSIATTSFVQHWIAELQSQIQQQGEGITDDLVIANGYAKFKDGLIFQWGEVGGWVTLPPDSASPPISFSLPVAFPTACCSFQVTDGGGIGGYGVVGCVDATTTDGVITFWNFSPATLVGVQAHCFAIGY